MSDDEPVRVAAVRVVNAFAAVNLSNTASRRQLWDAIRRLRKVLSMEAAARTAHTTAHDTPDHGPETAA